MSVNELFVFKLFYYCSGVFLFLFLSSFFNLSLASFSLFLSLFLSHSLFLFLSRSLSVFLSLSLTLSFSLCLSIYLYLPFFPFLHSFLPEIKSNLRLELWCSRHFRVNLFNIQSPDSKFNCFKCGNLRRGRSLNKLIT
jgi:hypothetical protein